jgi:hypothetical protein
MMYQVRYAVYSILDGNRAKVKLAFRHYVAHLSSFSDDDAFYLSAMQLRALVKDIKCSSRALEELGIVAADVKKSRPPELFALKSDASSGRSKGLLSMSEFAEVLVRIASVQFHEQREWTIDQKLASFFELHFLPNVQTDQASSFRSLLAHSEVSQVLEAHTGQIRRIFAAAAGSGLLTLRTFVDMMRKASLVNEKLSLSRLKVIFMASKFKDTDEELADWRDWDFLMGLAEFVEAVAYVAAARELNPSTPLHKSLSRLTAAELVESIGKLADTALLREGVRTGTGSVLRRTQSSSDNPKDLSYHRRASTGSWSPVPQPGQAPYLSRAESLHARGPSSPGTHAAATHLGNSTQF